MPSPADWPQADRRAPKRSSPTYAVRGPLAQWLREQAQLLHEELGPYTVLDVGCGRKPYYPFFEPFAERYVGLDVPGNPEAELDGFVESMPVDDGAFQVVLCSQVLEHCDDPARAVAELERVTAPGGRVLASTHGVQVYHPSPTDYWRWTAPGLERLFLTNGSWASVSVTPASGTASCLAMLLSIYLDLAARRAHLGPLARPLVAALNGTGAWLDARSERLRSGPGSMPANFHVLAVRA